MINMSVSSPEGSYIEDTWMPFPVSQYVIHVIMSLSLRKRPVEFMNISVREDSSILNSCNRLLRREIRNFKLT
jgi:hypothetical protein